MRQLISASRTPIPTRLSLVLDFALLVFLATWIVWWPDLVPGERGPRVDPPLVEHYWNRGELYYVRYVTLTKDARVYLGQERVCMENLGDRLQEMVRAHGAWARARGWNGSRAAPGGGWLSRLSVIVRADRAAPWGAVHRVLRLAGERGISQLHFLARKRDRMWSRVRTRLWAGLEFPARRPRSDVRVRIVPDPLGGVLYVVNGCGHSRIAAAREAVLRAARSYDVEPSLLEASIEAAPHSRFEHVVAALEAVLESGIDHVVFLGRGPGQVSVAAVAVPVERD
jgi:biopolymer transport protein ExbD